MINKVRKKKWYSYTIREDREGNEKVRGINNRTDPDSLDEIFTSRLDPSYRKDSQEDYDWGGGRSPDGGGFGDTYADLVRAAQKGGQNSSRRVWENEAEKQRAKRAKKNWLAGKNLTNEEIRLLIKAGYDPKGNNINSSRLGTYQSELGRPMTATERKRKQRLKNSSK